MSRISEDKKTRIKEDILSFLYESYPKMFYTYEIAENLARDDEFILKLLNELKRDGIVNCLKETKGNKVRRKWNLLKETYDKYKELLS